MIKSDFVSQESAISEYISTTKSLKLVAKRYGFTSGWLIKQLDSRGISRRGNSEWKVNINNQKLACIDYNNGELVKSIASKYGVSRKTITEWLKKNGIKPLKLNERLGISDEIKSKARRLYADENMNCCEISRQLNVSHRSILDWVKDIKKTKSEISSIMAFKGQKRTFGLKGVVDTKFGLIRYDSSYERDRIIQLCSDDNVQMVARCKEFIKYNDRTYNPDFLVNYKCGCVCIEEVKPTQMLGQQINKDKFESAKRFCKEKNILFKVVTQKEIYGK